MRILFIIILFITAMAIGRDAAAQSESLAPTDASLVNGTVTDKDTMFLVYMQELIVSDKLPQRFQKQREQFNRLRYNVQRTYPYAVIAAQILKDVNARTGNMEKRDKKQYLKIVEKELNKRFKGELQNLSINQGQILVKLISRQTGRNCFSLIKEVKGGFNAVVFQSVALLFSNNLKREYDPTDRDKDIEAIVTDIETSNYYQWKASQQQVRN